MKTVSNAGVTVITQDGRNLRKESADRQMTEEELDAKFSHLVGPAGWRCQSQGAGSGAEATG